MDIVVGVLQETPKVAEFAIVGLMIQLIVLRMQNILQRCVVEVGAHNLQEITSHSKGTLLHHITTGMEPHKVYVGGIHRYVVRRQEEDIMLSYV